MQPTSAPLLGAVLLAWVANGCAPAARATPSATSPASAGTVSSSAVLPATSHEILDEHNRVRQLHCATPLAWSAQLAAVAQRWADQLRDQGCGFEHSGSDYGENLASGTTGSLPAKDVVTMWVDEQRGYDFARGDFSSGTGHFTQVVWRGSTELGCGMSQCNGMDVWVCNYSPAGNMEGEYRQNVLPEGCK